MGVANSLPRLPLKLRYVADMLPFCGFSVGNRLLCGAIAASAGASRSKYYRAWSKSLDGGGVACYGASGGRVMPMPLVVDRVIWGFPKTHTLVGAQKFGLCCYR